MRGFSRNSPGTDGLASSQSEIAYETIRELILTGELPPAEVLSEVRLMQRLNVGRTPIREALLRLAHEGRVKIIPRKGTVVAPVNTFDVLKVLEVRRELEGLSARLAAQRITGDELRQFEQFLSTLESAEEGSYKQVAVDREFHLRVARATHNEVLVESIEWYFDLSVRLVFLSKRPVSAAAEMLREYESVLDALRSRDSEGAAIAMQFHIHQLIAKYQLSR